MAQLGITAEHTGLQQQILQTRLGPGQGSLRCCQERCREFTGGLVALATHQHRLIAEAQLLNNLAILGEGAGFVGADHGDRTQSLHRRQAPDQGSTLHHALGADRQGDGDNCRQALRHNRHRHRQGNFEQVERVLTQQQPKAHNNCHQGQGCANQHLG